MNVKFRKYHMDNSYKKFIILSMFQILNFGGVYPNMEDSYLNIKIS